MSLKEYLDAFNQSNDDLELEITLQRRNGINYEQFTEYELTEMFMKDRTKKDKNRSRMK